MMTDDLTKSFKYKDSTKCYMEFTSINEIEPVKRYRLDKLLAGSVSLPKEKVLLDKIVKDAQEKGVILVSLVLANGKKEVLRHIKLDGSSNEKSWYVPSCKHSYIEYINEFTKPLTLPSITVSNFL